MKRLLFANRMSTGRLLNAVLLLFEGWFIFEKIRYCCCTCKHCDITLAAPTPPQTKVKVLVPPCPPVPPPVGMWNGMEKSVEWNVEANGTWNWMFARKSSTSINPRLARSALSVLKISWSICAVANQTCLFFFLYTHTNVLIKMQKAYTLEPLL